ncbi:MAG: thymidine phosphorylase [Polyangiaceae bacterium]|nr:thymidine phosphorylase [Polyangiaceae bacterium]
MASINPVALIIKKRDGHALTRAEIQALVDGYVSGQVADYQMSAWLMAAFLRGMTDAETVALTETMLHSGDVLRLPTVRAPKVDKHSTGGVGDKISLCLAPLVAECGVSVPMISGRGLGHTGGTLDKLEAIPGYRVDLDAKRFERQVRELGLCIIGQTARLAPADRRIYALRDVTGTVEFIPFIVASILSKKLAEGIDGLVLDVKVGRGAFMKDRQAARELARAMVRVGSSAGKRVVALLTDMNVPIGRTIGNALETREAIEVLMNEGPEDTRELTLVLGTEMLLVGGVTRRAAEARRMLEAALTSGRGLRRFARMVEAQGGDPRVVMDPTRLPSAKLCVPVPATGSGYVSRCDALELGLTSVAMGAGRLRAEDAVDHRVGIVLDKKPGDRVKRGEVLAWLHVQSKKDGAKLVERVRSCFSLGKTAPKPSPLLLERIVR